MEQLNEWGKVAGSLSAILALTGIVLVKPVRAVIRRRKAEREEQLRMLRAINEQLKALTDDIGDLQYERLSQAQDFYTAQGWCPGAKKEMLCQMHKSYRAKGRNHLSEHYEAEIMRLPDRPANSERRFVYE